MWGSSQGVILNIGRTIGSPFSSFLECFFHNGNASLVFTIKLLFLIVLNKIEVKQYEKAPIYPCIMVILFG